MMQPNQAPYPGAPTQLHLVGASPRMPISTPPDMDLLTLRAALVEFIAVSHGFKPGAADWASAFNAMRMLVPSFNLETLLAEAKRQYGQR